MTGAGVEIRTATRSDRVGLVGVLAAAFVHDPVVDWLLGEPTGVRRHELFFRALTRSALTGGGCDLAVDADGQVLGAAVWYPPGRLVPGPVDRLRQLPDLIRAFGRRLGAAAEADDTMLAHHPSEPHWYLQFIGVRPDSVGRGIGTALLAHRLAVIDRERLPAYLESSSARNDPLYARHGFAPTGTLRLGPDAPAETLMLRPAAET